MRSQFHPLPSSLLTTCRQGIITRLWSSLETPHRGKKTHLQPQALELAQRQRVQPPHARDLPPVVALEHRLQPPGACAFVRVVHGARKWCAWRSWINGSGGACCAGDAQGHSKNSIDTHAHSWMRQLLLPTHPPTPLCSHPSSPRSASGALPGVAAGHAVSARTPRHRRSRWRPIFRRPFLLNRRSVAPPRGARGTPSASCQAVSASCVLGGRSRYCASRGRAQEVRGGYE